MNQVVLVGRIVKQELKENELYLTISVSKPFKNDKGEYEINLISCLLKGAIADNTNKFCNENDIVGIKGCLENKEDRLYVLAEKVTFLSSKSG